MSAAGERAMAYLGLGDGPRRRKTGWGWVVIALGSTSGGVLFGATSAGSWPAAVVGVVLFALAMWIGRTHPVTRPVA